MADLTSRDGRRCPAADVSVVIVSWNGAGFLGPCLDSLLSVPSERGEASPRRPALPTIEIVVVDNASTDGSPCMVRQSFPGVRLLENTENRGFARANNQGFAASTGRYVLLLNPDTEVRPGAVEAMFHFMEGNPGVGAVGPRLLNPDGTLQPSCYPEPSLAREFWRLFHLERFYRYAMYPVDAWALDCPREVEVVQGAGLMVRREALDQGNGLDEDYFIYTEEVDLCHRLRSSGWKVFWQPQPAVVHHGGRSTRLVPREMFLQLYRSKILFFRKRRGATSARLYKLILLLASIARLVVAPLSLVEREPSRSNHLALARNYWRLALGVAWM